MNIEMMQEVLFNVTVGISATCIFLIGVFLGIWVSKVILKKRPSVGDIITHKKPVL